MCDTLRCVVLINGLLAIREYVTTSQLLSPTKLRSQVCKATEQDAQSAIQSQHNVSHSTRIQKSFQLVSQ